MKKIMLVASILAAFYAGTRCQEYRIRKLQYKLEDAEWRLRAWETKVEQAEKVSKITGASLYQVLTGIQFHQ